MGKFMVLYSSTMSASDLMANATPEQMQTSMAEWMAWAEEVGKSMKFEFGMPMQAVGQVNSSGLADSTSNVSGYSTIEADTKEAVFEAVKNHPHLKRPGATIDVLEMLSMPGM